MKITLSKEKKANALRSIQQFFEEDIEMALGGLQAGSLRYKAGQASTAWA
ncbi:DUF2164 family protein [Pontiella agarivorans]|uniref:DUF2164 family protein n=1 Tax=Pontiella agarivorans TaxID=3038953 RepID=A0ABU5MX86_9BACT|nr:DUF2164 family protein [Pontiella agarivorans]MDZ8118820.1 DUF2164 family protein [Pontiella agarivorans]